MFLQITHSFVQISLIPELICSPCWDVTSLWPHSPLNNGALLILKITMFKFFGVLAFNPYLLRSVHSSVQPFTSKFSSSSSLHRLFFFMVGTSNFHEDTCKEGFHSRGQQLCKLIGTKESFTFYISKSSTPRGLVWNTNMAAVLLFWNTNTVVMWNDSINWSFRWKIIVSLQETCNW